MTDDRVLDYLRSRGQATPPVHLVSSVMAAIDTAPEPRSRFAAYLPAFAAAGAIAGIALVALLVGPGRVLGPSPTSTPTSGPSVEATIDDLGVALLDAVDVLQAAPGVEGRQQVEIDGVIGAVTWFDWRPNGDQVVVQRQDLDVTETGWWMVPDGAPPTTGERIHTGIRVAIGDELFVTGEAGGWEVLPREFGFATGSFGTAILDGAVLPWRPLDGLVTSLPAEGSDVRVERGDLPDGGVEWRLERQWMGTPLIQRWTVGPGGELRSWTFEREDRSVDPDGDFNANATHGWLEYTITGDDPIEPPDVGTEPDAAAVGAPPDLPLQPPPVSLDDVEQVETCEHPSGVYRVTLPDGWWTNRDGSPDALWEACELFGPEPFAVTPAADRTWPSGLALTIGWIDGGCRGFIWDLLSSEPTTVDGLPASINEYTLPGDGESGYAYEYVIDLSDPGVDCEVGGRWIGASTNREMTGDYDENKAFLDRIMATMEITPP